MADSSDREALFWHFPQYHKTLPYGAIRHGDQKLIEFFEGGKLELYDLKADPNESNDLSESQPDNVKELLAALRDWRKSVCAQLPTPTPNYDPSAKLKSKRKGKKKP